MTLRAHLHSSGAGLMRSPRIPHLLGRTALVTGASRGIALMPARCLAESGRRQAVKVQLDFRGA